MKRKETTKNSTKKRVAFSFFKKHKALSVSLVIIAAAVASFLVVNYGRYVKDIIQVYYLRTKNFYFNSDKLTILGKTYQINPWDGTEPYTININMNSFANSLKGTEDNIVYDVRCVADTNSVCYFGTMGTTTQRRTIYSANHTDNFVVTVALKNGIDPDDIHDVNVQIIASSVSPYEEELKATFNLVIGDYGVGYKIEDEAGRLYMDALVSNATPNDTYKFVLEITDVSKYSIDMSNNILSAPGTVVVEDAQKNIKRIEFNVEPKSSMMVRYYKSNPEENKTYPNDNGLPPAINISYTKIT